MKTILIFNLMLLTVFVFGWEDQKIEEDKKEGAKEERHRSNATMVTDVAPQHRPKEEAKEEGDKEEAKEKGHRSSATMVTDVAPQHRPKEEAKEKITVLSFKETKAKKKKKTKKLPTWLKEDGIYKDKLMLWGGIGSHLYGYYDERYAGDDKGAYLKSSSFNTGLEYYKEGFGGASLKDIRIGVNIAFQSRKAFGEKTLPEMNYANGIGGTVEEKTIPTEAKDINAESWVNLGFFAGLDNKWYGIDLGLTVSLNPYYEKEREMIDGSKEEVNRWLWGSAEIIPNFHLRLGQEDSVHFVFNVLREDYDLKYGVINIYVSLPLHKNFGIDIGGYLYQTDSIFIAPKVNIGAFTAKVKMGTILNYQDSTFTKVAIFDSLFGNFSLSYEW